MTKGRPKQKPSDPRHRLSIVWDTIERIAFRPKGDKEQKKWLGLYQRTLHDLWEEQPAWERMGKDGSYLVPFLGELFPGELFRYFIETFDRYNASLSNHSTKVIVWKIHVDPDYVSKASLHSAPKELFNFRH